MEVEVGAAAAEFGEEVVEEVVVAVVLVMGGAEADVSHPCWSASTKPIT